MYNFSKRTSLDYPLTVLIGLIVVLSLIALTSVAGSLFPTYYLYIGFGILLYLFFSNFEFAIIKAFSRHLYFASIFFLILPIIIGQVTRDTIRWIPIGSLSIQPAEIVRPFLILFFADFLVNNEFSGSFIFKAFLYFLLPVALIVIQPSLGVAIITAVGIFGTLISSGINKRHFIIGLAIFILSLPVSWFVMKDYQRQRIVGFINPEGDPLGAGYNSIQSVISIGSGGVFGKGLGKGVQTQLEFLPEKQTDFIFASISEELGFLGAMVLILLTLAILYRLVTFMENAKGPVERAYLSGFLMTLLVQITIHIGMNLGLLPITGLPYPLVSAGGSSFIATMAGLGIAASTRRK